MNFRHFIKTTLHCLPIKKCTSGTPYVFSVKKNDDNELNEGRVVTLVRLKISATFASETWICIRNTLKLPSGPPRVQHIDVSVYWLHAELYLNSQLLFSLVKHVIIAPQSLLCQPYPQLLFYSFLFTVFRIHSLFNSSIFLLLLVFCSFNYFKILLHDIAVFLKTWA
jgi:hypothetical protein